MRPTPGPIDLALLAIDPEAVLDAVRGPTECRLGPQGGTSGSEDDHHELTVITCPRPGGDRTLGFEFMDAYEAAIKGAGAVVDSSGADLGDVTEPVIKFWRVIGNVEMGTARVIMINMPGSFVLSVTFDIAVR